MAAMIRDLKPRDQVQRVFAVGKMELVDKDGGKRFLVLELHDRTGMIKGYVWNDPDFAATTVCEKSFIEVTGTVKEYGTSLLINVTNLRTVNQDEYSIEDFIEVVPGGVEHWQCRFYEAAGNVTEPHCSRLIEAFVTDEAFMQLFSSTAGGLKVHHAYVGGLLEHTVQMMEVADFIASRHPGYLDRDIMITGAFLHDIGKTGEISGEISRQHTDAGRLIGHIDLGVEILRNKISGIDDFPDKLTLALTHIILSHHGELEFGSPVRPATPEALAIHLIDNMDAKLNHLFRHLEHMPPDKVWSAYDRILQTEVCRLGVAEIYKDIDSVKAA